MDNVWPTWVGQSVQKKSRKPFKSGAKVGTVKAVTINPNTNRTAFTFMEDDSVVDCGQTYLSKPGVEQ
jgi:hypothetical protein